MKKTIDIQIRQETPTDYTTVYDLTKEAFAGQEYADGDEQELPQRLRKKPGFIPELSLVAELGGQVVGHILFTEIKIDDHPALCLGPVSVLPEFQLQGIGGALIHKGHETAQEFGFSVSVLVGHKDYYPRFGYEPIIKHGITFPFEVPDEFCMVHFLTEEGKVVKGMAKFPPELMP